MSKLKIGVFGGYRGMTMIEALIGNADAELVAVCDKYQPILDKVKKLSEENGMTVGLYNNFEDFICHDMDAVILANYATEHAIYAVKCLEKGKHVMSEVLPAETPAQMVKLVEAVEKTGLVYTYAENYCYMRQTFEMWKRYKNGDIGEIQYGEGEYIHDCSSIWPDITYGERDHWRNRSFPTFYCTHSVGPLITISGLRPVQVVGFEVPRSKSEKNMRIGFVRAGGIEMVTLENGAVLKSIHGDMKREPGSTNYQVYGMNGMMESKRYNDEEFNIYREEDKLCQGTWEKYDPYKDVEGMNLGHGGGDNFTTKFFIDKILGREDGKWAIDVYTACDMGLCGLMAFRSILDGNKPKKIPNFRLKEDRDEYRNDNACTNPEVAGDQLLPTSAQEMPYFDDEVYENVRKRWLREPSPLDDIFC